MRIFGIKELFESTKYIRLVSILTYLDFKRKYRRSFLGAFWGTVSILLTIAIASFVFGLNIQGETRNSLLYIACGMIIWNMVSTSITESCDSFLLNEAIIRQIRIPFYVYSYRVVARNLIFLLHNIIIIPIIYFYSPFVLSFKTLWFIPSLFLIALNLVFLCTTISIFSTRFRDFGQFVTNGMPLIFYATPILWSFDTIKFSPEILNLLKMNPVLYFVDIFRAPLIGENILNNSLLICISFTLINFLFSVLLYEKFKNKIAYWI